MGERKKITHVARLEWYTIYFPYTHIVIMSIGLISVAASENHTESWEAKYISLIDVYEEISYCICTYVCL